MTPAKRRPATPASQGPTRTAPDVPIVADPPPGGVRPSDAPTAASDTPVSDEGVTALVLPAETTAPTDAGQVDAEEGATAQAPPRPLSLYPLPVWPD